MNTIATNEVKELEKINSKAKKREAEIVEE
jgi:hypothetical protein